MLLHNLSHFSPKEERSDELLPVIKKPQQLTCASSYAMNGVRAQTSGVASPKFLGAKMFRRATVFCLGRRFSKHKMTRYAKNVGGMPPLGYSYGSNLEGAHASISTF